MSAIGKISSNLSSKLGNRLNKNEEEIAVLNYGLFIIIHTFISIIATIAIGVITGLVLEIVIIAFTGALFKRYSGGIHASTPANCTIIGVLLAFIMSLVCKYLSMEISINGIIVVIGVLLAICSSILYIKCPVASKNKPFKNESARKKIRKRAFNLAVFCSILMFLMLIAYVKVNLIDLKTIAIAIALGMSLQMFAITNTGTRFIQMLDKMLSIKK